MSAVVNAIKELIKMVGTLFDFAISFFEDLVYAIGLLGEFVLNIPEFFNWLPGSAMALIVTTFGIVVVYVVVGRR